MQRQDKYVTSTMRTIRIISEKRKIAENRKIANHALKGLQSILLILCPPFKTGPKITDMPLSAVWGTSVIFRFSKMQNDNTFHYLRNLSYRSNPAAGKLGPFDGESTLNNPRSVTAKKNTQTGVGSSEILHIFVR